MKTVQYRHYYKNPRSEMLQFLPEEYQEVLEIGCGEGNFALQLKPGCKVWGVEVDKESDSAAGTHLNKVLHGKYSQVSDEIPTQYCDLIICNDVIEHMEDAEAFLLSIRQKMKFNGFIVASIPNVRYYYNLFELLFQKDWCYREEGILDQTHLRFFTEKSIKRLMSKHRFAVEKLEGINKANIDFRVPKSKWDIFHIIVKAFTVLGFHKDVLFLQFGLRGRRL